MRLLIPPRFNVVRSVRRAFVSTPLSNFLLKLGATPICPLYPTDELSPSALDATVECQLTHCDGIFLQGGSDIDPRFYGEEIAGSIEVDRVRDSFELHLVKAAVERQIPVFGICRGFQLINVAFGGSLHQHLSYDKWDKHYSTSGSERDFSESAIDCVLDLSHRVSLTKGGILTHLLKQETIEVPSHHHQGINRLGSELFVEAVSDDGIVECFSNQERGIVGVQWHPESDKEVPLVPGSVHAMPIEFWYEQYVVKRSHAS